ncbi:MAG TPA: zincin-like metallopeptidase domain-containing protein, partial [Candidatus Acidoferrales bacterium]|nr:zincin-like metallopeptidase domain-containing protein [Candidatus Acidoferrales bacterium]
SRNVAFSYFSARTTHSAGKGAGLMPSSYEVSTAQIIKQLESGVIPWRKPWTSRLPMNLKSQKEYRGINVFLLASQGYASPYWLTYKQAASIGGNVKKGEHGTKVCFWKIGEYSKDNPDTGEAQNHKSVLLRHYTVFNVLQCENLPDFGTGRVVNPIADCESVVSAMPNAPKIIPSDAAWYRPSTDTIGIPPINTFHGSAGYYSTLFHEFAHSTGHASRVGREGIENLNAFGSESYSKEELVAELGAAMLCGVTGIEKSTLENSAAYIATWIKRLKDDSKLIISAASQAQKAADYILGKSASVPDADSNTEGAN